MASEPQNADTRTPARRELASLRIDRDASPRPRPRRALWIGGILLGALALALAWALFIGGATDVPVVYAKRTAPQAVPATEVLTGSGYVVTADRYISLGVRVSSRIVAYLVEEGERVEAGQALVKLDARQYEATLAESKAALARTRADVELFTRELERARQLHAQNVASNADLDVAQNRLRVARAEVARLEAQVARQQVDVEDTVVRAPTSGVILEKFKEVGEIAVPGGFQGSGELIRMANLEKLRAELDVNEADLARISLGQPARVTPEAYPDRAYTGRVVKLYPQINRQKGTLKVEVEILEPDGKLRPDMSVRVAFLSESPTNDVAAPEGVVLIPREAVRIDAGENFAWVVTDGALRRQAIEVSGPTPSGDWVVTRGLSGGESLVVGEAAGLREGQRVETRP